MLAFISLLPLAFASLATAQERNNTRRLEVLADFQAACLPRDINNNIMTISPCFSMMGIVSECGWGDSDLSTYERSLPLNGDTGNQIRVSDQRACFCQSQYFDVLKACQACIRVNNIPINDTIIVHEAGLTLPSPSLVSSFTSSYCAITNTPTANFGEAVYGAFNWPRRTVDQTYQLVQTLPTSLLPTATSYTTYEGDYGYTQMSDTPTAFPVIPQTGYTGDQNAWVTQIASAVPTLATSNGQIVPAGVTAQKEYLSMLTASAASSKSAAAASATHKGAAPRDPPKKPATTGSLLALIAALILCH